MGDLSNARLNNKPKAQRTELHDDLPTLLKLLLCWPLFFPEHKYDAIAVIGVEPLMRRRVLASMLCGTSSSNHRGQMLNEGPLKSAERPGRPPATPFAREFNALLDGGPRHPCAQRFQLLA